MVDFLTLISKFILFVARVAPRGYWRLIRYAAARDTSLLDYPLKMRHCQKYTLRSDLRDSVYTGIFRFGYIPHQIGLDLLCIQLLRPGDIVIDVGANIGYTSILFLNAVGKPGRVVSIEPSPRSFYLLQRALSEYENVICLNIAASYQVGYISFFVHKSLDLASCLPVDGANQVQVKSDTIDHVAEMYGKPNLVKVDVEGFEPNVFRGMSSTLNGNDRPILIFEALTMPALKECLAVLNELSWNGYKYFRVNMDGRLLNYDSTIGTSDYLALPEWAWEKVLSV